MTYTITRPVMTKDELAENQVLQYGRNYAESDDGYGDMAAEEGRGWRAIAGWGRDGWDLGDWPYVVIYASKMGEPGRPFGLMQICEGDRTVYAFATEADRDAAVDYLFLWYAAGQSWAPVGYADRGWLEAGIIAVDEKWRGPYRAG